MTAATAVLTLVAAVLFAAGCASSPPAHLAADPVLAQAWSAEITAADTLRTVVLTDVGNRYRAHQLSVADLSIVRAAGLRLEAAVRIASSELRVYLAKGVVLESLESALRELQAAKTGLELARDAVNRRAEAASTTGVS